MLTRRRFLQTSALFAALHAKAAPYKGKVKITNIQAMQTKLSAGNCLIRIQTDAGLTGYGEAGASGPMARARIATMRRVWEGQDPLSIEKLFHEMTTLMHPYMAHIPTISGIDLALWDLAGKITGLPVHVLLGGPFRDAIPMYSHGNALGDMLDKGACREWAAHIRQRKEGFRAFKLSVDKPAGVTAGRFANSLDQEQIRRVRVGFQNVREAVGDEIGIACHCHNEFDVPSALAVARAIEPMDPLFYEDPLNVPYSESWLSLKRQVKLPVLTGEKLELLTGFKPFIDTQACDIVHPDLAFAGGITGTRKIAAYAAALRMPVALHNVGTLVLTHASAHFAAGIQNFYRSESALGRPTGQVEKMAAGPPPKVANGLLQIPEGPGLGLDLNWDYIRTTLEPGETLWN